MLTLSEAAAVKQQASFLTDLATEYKAFLTTQGLPFSVDMPELLGALRQQLFKKLLTVDKGLAMRWDMARTDAARQKLIDENVNLDGHETDEQLQSYISRLESGYRRIALPRLGWLFDNVHFLSFASRYQLDINQVIDDFTIRWAAGDEHVLAYFTDLAERLNFLRGLFRPLYDSTAPLGDVLMKVAEYYQHAGRSPEPVAVDEVRLHQQLLPLLKQRSLLASIPTTKRPQ